MKYLFLLLVGIILHQVSVAQGCTGNYVEPSFQLQKSDPTCEPNSGQIWVVNTADGVGPFTYRLVESNTTNTTGTFNGLGPGLYTVELRDACGTVRTRQVTLVHWSFSFSFDVKMNSNCFDGTVSITPNPSNVQYEFGVVRDGDTVWSNSADIDIKLYKKLTILVKDACGNMQSKTWHAPSGWLPYIDALQYQLFCDSVSIFPVYYGYTNGPVTVCLYNFQTKALIECKTAPAGYSGGYLTNFFGKPYGVEYYVIVSDSCYRDSAYFPDMTSAGGSQIDPYDWDCSTFKMHVDGPAPPASFYANNPTIYGSPDSICLFRQADNSLVGCKPLNDHLNWINPRTGQPWESGAVWDSLPYGCYYAYIFDPCMDTTFRIDSCVTSSFDIRIGSIPACSFSQTQLGVHFDPGSKGPFTVNVYNKDGSLNSTFSTTNYSPTFQVNTPTTADSLMVVGLDACGNSDTSFIVPNVLMMSKSISVANKCPGISGNSGSGDVAVMATTFSEVRPQPRIIRKNNQVVDITYSHYNSANSTYAFPNLESGTYVFEYSLTYCSQIILFDTVVVPEYVYPTQNPDTAIQCGGNMFSFTFPIVGGLSPYTFQIIANTPASPSLVTAPQSSPTFVVGNGQHYTNVKVRAIDRCGNSTIGDIIVEPINDCSVLPVDSIEKSMALQNHVVKVFPNPAKGQFTISLSKKKKTNYRVEIINSAGVRLYQQLLFNVDRKDIIVNERFAPGLYIVNVTDLQSGRVSAVKQLIQ